MHNPRDDQAARPKVIAAGPSDAARVIDMLMLAFAADPPNRWLFPDAHDYVRNFPKFVQGLGGSAFANGTAFMTPDCSGAILWLAPNVGPDEEALSRLIEEGVAPDKQADLAAAIDEMGRYPQEPHWYLPFIGAIRRGRGRGLAPRCCGRCWRSVTPTACRPISNPQIRRTARSISGTASRSWARSEWRVVRRSHRCCVSRASLQRSRVARSYASLRVTSSKSSSILNARGVIFCSTEYSMIIWSGFSSASMPKGWKSIPSGEGGIAAFVSFSMR